MGPMLYGMTYMTRPDIAPANNRCNFSFIFAGSSQLLVGPAASWVREQMKVRSSTRATSPGLDPACRVARLLPPMRLAPYASCRAYFRSWFPYRRLSWTYKRSPSCGWRAARPRPTATLLDGRDSRPSIVRLNTRVLLAGGRDRGLDLRHDAFQVLEGLIDGKRIHFAT